MTAMMKDPATPLRTRLALYLFFLLHTAAFGTATFYVTYHLQRADAYVFGAIAILVYVPFYLILFGADEVLWLVITSVLGLTMVYSWLETLALPFIPEPGTGSDRIITEFGKFPASRHILPGTFLVMYQFMLRNLLIDMLGARHNQARDRYVGWLFIAVSAAQILLGGHKG